MLRTPCCCPGFSTYEQPFQVPGNFYIIKSQNYQVSSCNIQFLHPSRKINIWVIIPYINKKNKPAHTVKGLISFLLCYLPKKANGVIG